MTRATVLGALIVAGATSIVISASQAPARPSPAALAATKIESGLEYAATIGKALATVKDVDTLIVGHSPLRTIPDLREYQRFMTDFVAAVRQAKQAGTTADDAAASINLDSKYPGYRHERYKAAVQAIYTELGT